MNCFQKLLSSWWRTAIHQLLFYLFLLWIAFKNYYLRDEGQHAQTRAEAKAGCELLSKIIIFVMKDSENSESLNLVLVVNCFQKLLSSWWRTADFSLRLHRFSLWIAFKNYYLRDEGQLSITNIIIFHSCELLSKIIIFVMKDSMHKLLFRLQTVVNCFQKLLSSWWRTALLSFFAS